MAGSMPEMYGGIDPPPLAYGRAGRMLLELVKIDLRQITQKLKFLSPNNDSGKVLNSSYIPLQLQ